MRIAVVGPTHPFKGGIAQHTTELARRLAAEPHDVTLVSWRHQYPARLYPGRLEVPGDRPDGPAFEQVHRVLDWYDPAGWRRVGRALRSADLVLVAHSNPFQVPAYTTLLAAARGAHAPRPARVLVAHNIVPHDAPGWQRRSVGALARRLDGVVVHSDAELLRAGRYLPGVPARVAPLPPHGPTLLDRAAYSPTVPLDPTRIRVLVLGFVRPYKGIPLLLEAARAAPQIEVTIRGECWDDGLDRTIRHLAASPGLAGRVDYRPGYVATDEFGALFAAHDVAALPYLEATGSQNAALAMSYGLPVLVSDLPALTAGVTPGTDGLIATAGDVGSWRDLLRQLDGTTVASLRSGVRPPNPDAAWRSYLDAVCAFVPDRGGASPAGVGPRPRDRGAHVVDDPGSRARKAEAIGGVLTERRPLPGLRLLDDGCGSGHIAAHLATLVGTGGFVLALDRGDGRVARSGAGFTIADGGHLPLRDRSIDVVVSNHVLEHVGDHPDQARYLTEIRRVLRDDGLLYLAVPNRFRLLEAHYDLPLLSWLPGPAADRYVRLLGRADWYDVVAPSRRGLADLLRHSEFEVEDVTAAAARGALGRLPAPLRLGARVPDALLRPALAVVPTFVVVCRPACSVGPAASG